MTATCLNCGSEVSDSFARVLGDNHDRVHACNSCAENSVGEAVAGLDSQKLTGVGKRT